MEKKTIGAFLAVLRKASGMTQQQVADRLNVSNKTVSKWECDESLPDITLIPVLAEMFHVTSDEILRGQRLEGKNEPPEKTAEKTAVQARSLIARTMAKHLNGLTAAASLLAVGMIALFTVSYAFYMPVLGFGIYLILLLASQVVGLLAFNTARTALIGGGLLPEAEEQSAAKQLLSLTLKIIEAGAATVVFALPLILIQSDVYTYSVISASAYLALLPTLLATSVLVVLLTRMICVRIRPELNAEYAQTASRLKRLYWSSVSLLFLVLIPAFSGTIEAGSTVESFAGLNFRVEFNDAQAAGEYREMAADYAQGGDAWKEYCRTNLLERGLPWNGSIDDYIRDELAAHGFLNPEPELAEDDLIDFWYSWAFAPEMQNASETEVSFNLEWYRIDNSEEAGGALIAALPATLIIAAAVVLRRKHILAESKAQLPEEEQAATEEPEAESEDQN